jgi:ribosome biogenesis GTPase A
MDAPSLEKRALIIGGTGVGKSFILNRLLKKNSFRSGFQTRPITSEIASDNATFQVDSERFSLCAFDTPGILSNFIFSF